MIGMIVAITARDLKLAMRRQADIVSVLFFFIIVASLFPLGIGPEPGDGPHGEAGVGDADDGAGPGLEGGPPGGVGHADLGVSEAAVGVDDAGLGSGFREVETTFGIGGARASESGRSACEGVGEGSD